MHILSFKNEKRFCQRRKGNLSPPTILRGGDKLLMDKSDKKFSRKMLKVYSTLRNYDSGTKNTDNYYTNIKKR